ncbi:hypothetical protein [Algicella marina]|uniref:Uncharacterized protein n=1 Tax=Algicella marina TaxID=2683284 RepID=A0A6P1T0G5_9RHOB|nr:hypothetical protein [Algicella marina]QHQ35221.1 hypothetical protein GO499_08420 [Algicella marina]
MDNSLHIKQMARSVAQRAIPKPVNVTDEAALRLIECAISITLSQVVGSRERLGHLLTLAQSPFETNGAERFRQFDYKDQGAILHRARKAVSRLHPNS